MCEASQDLMPEPRFLLDAVWFGGQLGDNTNWDLHFCACQKVQMGPKMVANEYWRYSLTLTTCTGFIAPLLEERAVLGNK